MGLEAVNGALYRACIAQSLKACAGGPARRRRPGICEEPGLPGTEANSKLPVED